MRLLLGLVLCLAILAALGLNTTPDHGSNGDRLPETSMAPGPLMETPQAEPGAFLSKLGGIQIVLSVNDPDFKNAPKPEQQAIMEQALRSVGQKLDDYYDDKEYKASLLSGQRILLEILEGEAADAEVVALLFSEIGVSSVGDPGHSLTFHLEYSDEEATRAKGDAPVAALLLPMASEPDGEILLFAEPVMNVGRHIIDVHPDFSNKNYPPVVTITLNAAGAELFEHITAQNIGRKLAIVLDDTVLMAPIVHDIISGGKLSISGNFTMREASEVSQKLQSASFAPPLSILESRIIAPAVGKGVGS